MKPTKSIADLGRLVLWYGGNTFSLEMLSEVLTSHGLSGLTPKTQSPKAALSEAVNGLFKKQGAHVTPVKGTTAYAVLDKESDAISLDVSTRRRFSVYIADDGTDEGRIDLALGDSPAAHVDREVERERIAAEYKRQLARVAKEQVTTMLVGVCRALGGWPLNPDGGVYFIPETSWGKWEAIAKGVERASGSACSVQGIEMGRTPGAVRAAAGGFIADMEAKLERIKADLNEKGARAAVNRSDEIVELAGMAEEWHDLLGEAHERLRKSMVEVQARASQAAQRREDATEAQAQGGDWFDDL